MRLRNVCLLAMVSFAAQAQPDTWTEAMSQGRSLQNQGRFREAADLFQSALKEAERPPRSAARQAAAACQLDRDDIHWASMTHPGSIIWPAIATSRARRSSASTGRSFRVRDFRTLATRMRSSG